MAKDEQRITGGIRDKSPCAYCPADKRHPACHDSCEEFKAWRAKLEAVKEAREKYNNWRKYGTSIL